MSSSIENYSLEIEYNGELSNNMADSNAAFPVKLFAMLTFDGGPVVDWLYHGFAFRVYQVDFFSANIMPKYFKR